MADKPELTPSQKAQQARRILARLEERQQNARFARAIVNALNVARKPLK